MFVAALVALALAAAGGIFFATLHLTGRPVPLAYGVGHGLIAVTGLVLLLLALGISALTTPAFLALIAFILTALGGLLMLTLRLLGRPRPPLPIVALHGALAVTGLVLLIVDLVSRLSEGVTL